LVELNLNNIWNILYFWLKTTSLNLYFHFYWDKVIEATGTEVFVCKSESLSASVMNVAAV